MGLQKWDVKSLMQRIEPTFRKTARNLLALASIQWLALSCAAAFIGTPITTLVLLVLLFVVSALCAYNLHTWETEDEEEPTQGSRR
jgi:hypothetical protein